MNNHQAIMDNWKEELIYQKSVGNKVIGIQRFIFTYGVILDVKMWSYGGRYCFSDLTSALGFYNEYDGTQVPIIGKDGCTAIK